MTKLLGSERTDGCASLQCRGGKQTNGAGNGRPSQRRFRIIRVLTSRVKMQCQSCAQIVIRKTRKLDVVKGAKK